MPPKPKFTKEEIVEGAYNLLKEKGIDALVAREVGKYLGMTTAPIFTYFDTMEELKDAVVRRAQRDCADYLNGSMEYFPVFKEFGLRWIRFAKENPHAYELIFMRRDMDNTKGFLNMDFIEIMEPMKGEMVKNFGIRPADAEKLLRDMVLYAQGISSMIVSGVAEFPEEELVTMISRTCLYYVAGCQIEDGKLDIEQLRMMLGRKDRFPEKRKS